jgi:hypothetical protein
MTPGEEISGPKQRRKTLPSLLPSSSFLFPLYLSLSSGTSREKEERGKKKKKEGFRRLIPFTNENDPSSRRL